MSMPKQKPGRSKQDYRTPKGLLGAVVSHQIARRGLEVDLAATEVNKVATRCITPKQDSLSNLTKWPSDEVCWLNPPFANIEPWAHKCKVTTDCYSSRGQILLLVPASVGSEWFHSQIMMRPVSSSYRCLVDVIFLRPRIKFVGAKDPYPKDCMLVSWSSDYSPIAASPYIEDVFKKPAMARSRVAFATWRWDGAG